MPSGVTASALDATSSEWPYVAAAGIFTALTGVSGADVAARPPAISVARWETIADEVVAQAVRDATAVHYLDPHTGALDRISNLRDRRFV